MKNAWIILLLCLCVWAGCESTTVDPDFSRVGYVYFPVDSGWYRDYSVEDIVIPLVGSPDTQRYWLREQVGEVLSVSGQDTTRFLRRYSRTDSTVDWHLDSLWQIRRTATQAIVIENNVPRIKLVFPVAEDIAWDGNALALDERQTYFMQGVGIPYGADSSFSQTVTVIQSDNRDTIEQQNYIEEVFAADIGLILRQSFQFRYCNEDSCFGQQIVEVGRSYRQVLSDYGQ
ncbi:MAG TPA: hypothetical protein DCE41_17490 [Cytophagales bacterium]|nr:hypothetical protein [Cytophagales bacterium]HAA17432.1 hypothetical protein [Cytophagales bacterium]HAP59004.1 hypothetical protein [Cytophagales bacterium]